MRTKLKEYRTLMRVYPSRFANSNQIRSEIEDTIRGEPETYGQNTRVWEAVGGVICVRVHQIPEANRAHLIGALVQLVSDLNAGKFDLQCEEFMPQTINK